MNTNELKQFNKQTTEMGLSSMDVVEICKAKGWNTDNEKLNGINQLYCEGWHKSEVK